jgi:hypothetical protein
MSTESYVAADFIFVDTTKLPPLFTYQIVIQGRVSQQIGRRLLNQANQYFSDANCWVWSTDTLVSDRLVNESELQSWCQHLWRTDSNHFHRLQQIQRRENYQVTPQAQADYAQQIVKLKRHQQLQDQLAKFKQTITPLRIERSYELRSWVIQSCPALSIALQSHAILTTSLNQIVPKLAAIEELISLWVRVKTAQKTVRIGAIAGHLSEQRQHLLESTQSDELRSYVQQAPEEEWVVTVTGGEHYPLGVLEPCLDLAALDKFGLNSAAVTQAFRLRPQARREIIEHLVRAITPEPNWVTAAHYPDYFYTASTFPFPQKICFGNGQIAPHENKTLLANLQKYGVYQKAKTLQVDSTFKIGVIDARRDRQNTGLKEKLTKKLQNIGFRPQFFPPEQIETINQTTVEQALDRVIAHEPHILLALLPRKLPNSTSIYHRLKRLTVERGLPSQMVYEQTLAQKYIENNLILGLLAKTGNVLFTLAEPLDFADLIVSLDVARMPKQTASDSMNTTAIARVYLNTGQLLGYHLHDANLKGESLPRSSLEQVLPRSRFAEKRVIIHREGQFPEPEKHHLQQIAQSLDATFYLVEIRKTGMPRLYRQLIPSEPNSMGSTFGKPQKGDGLKLSETEALLVSSLPPFEMGTPQPLHVQSDAKLGIDRAITSILALTILHSGSVPQPRLPISIHDSEKITGLMLKGIKPKATDGDLPFWL